MIEELRVLFDRGSAPELRQASAAALRELVKAPHHALNLAEFVEREYPIAWGPSSGCYPWRILSWAANAKNPRLPGVEALAAGLDAQLNASLEVWAERALHDQPEDRTLILCLSGLAIAESAAAVTKLRPVHDKGAVRFFAAAHQHLPPHLADRACHEWLALLARTDRDLLSSKVESLPEGSKTRTRWELILRGDAAAVAELLDASFVGTEEGAWRFHAATQSSWVQTHARVREFASEWASKSQARSPMSDPPDELEMLVLGKAPQPLPSVIANRALYFVAKRLAEAPSRSTGIFDAFSALRSAPVAAFVQAFTRVGASLLGPHSPPLGDATLTVLTERPDFRSLLGQPEVESFIAQLIGGSDPRRVVKGLRLIVDPALEGLLGPTLDEALVPYWGSLSAKHRAEWARSPKFSDRSLWRSRIEALFEDLATRPGVDADTRLPAMRRLRARSEARATELLLSVPKSAKDAKLSIHHFLVESKDLPSSAVLEACRQYTFEPGEITSAILCLESRWPGCTGMYLRETLANARETGREEERAESIARLLEFRTDVRAKAREKWIEELTSWVERGWLGAGAVEKSLAVLRAEQAFELEGATEGDLAKILTSTVATARSVGGKIPGRVEWVSVGLTHRLAHAISQELTADRSRKAAVRESLVQAAGELERLPSFLGGSSRRIMLDAIGFLDALADAGDVGPDAVFRALRFASSGAAAKIIDPTPLAAELVHRAGADMGLQVHQAPSTSDRPYPHKALVLSPEEIDRVIRALLHNARTVASANRVELEARPSGISISFAAGERASDMANGFLGWTEGQETPNFQPGPDAYLALRALDRGAKKKRFRIGMQVEGGTLRFDIDWPGYRAAKGG